MIRFAFFFLVLLAGCRSSKTTPGAMPEAKSRLKPRVDPGDPCTVDAGVDSCGPGFYCYTSTIAKNDGGSPSIMGCVPQQGEGGPCVANNQCLSGVCCNVLGNAGCFGPGCF